MQLEDVYKLYMNDLYRYLLSLSKDHHIAEDLVQEAYYRAFLTLEDHEIPHIKAWLFRVAYNAFIDHQRKNKRLVMKEQIDEHLSAHTVTPEGSILEKESMQSLFDDLDILKEKEKHAVMLCDFHELSYQEAADIIGLNMNTFKSHLSRARKKLMARVKERMNRDEE